MSDYKILIVKLSVTICKFYYWLESIKKKPIEKEKPTILLSNIL